MRNKNTVVALLLIFVGICFYNLYWTYVQFSLDSKLEKAKEAYEAVMLKAQSEPLTAEDSVAIKAYEALLADEDFKETYNKAIENSFTLGLDLQGGMFVTLEIGVEDVVRQLAGNPTDSTFNQAINCALERQETRQSSFVPLFVECLKEIDPNASLGAIFSNQERGISVSTPDEEVIRILNEEADAAIDRTFNIIRTRIDQFGVVSPTIQKQESTGRILLELPGVKEPERVRKILRSTAKLEFWETHSAQEAFPVLVEINEKLKSIMGILPDSVAADTNAVEEELPATEVAADTSAVDTAGADTSASLSELLEETGEEASTEDQEAAAEKFRRENPLFAVLQIPAFDNQQAQVSPVVGYALAKDTAKVNEYLRMEEVKVLIPDDMRFLWTFKPYSEEADVYQLIAIKSNLENKPAMGGDVVSVARQDFDERGRPVVTMNMNAEGTRKWAQITEANVGRHIAIVLDNAVYSFPVVIGKIPNGNTQISGGFTVKEAQDLANVLRAGQLPVPARIEGEDVVGPTLGAANIRSGYISFVLALVVTLIFMALYYAKAGIVADLALLANAVFIAGCAAAFTIVLTLPGIAAIVLTVGMAVDANVLIFERIREEMAKGKTLKASIKAGFSNAFSSVMDANITTFLTGVVLYAFGVGPIRGFAVVLMIGIITSLIAALIITRLILDYYASKGKDSINFGFSFTTTLFDKIKISMVDRRKTFYMVSGTLVLASLISIATIGFKTGVDFQGGRQFVVEFTQDEQPAPLADADVEAARTKLTEDFQGNAPIIKTLSSNNQLLITTSYLVENREATDSVQHIMLEGLHEIFPDLQVTVLSSTDVGPTVASDIKNAAFESVLGSMLIIFLYILIRFRRWQYSLGAIVAIFHDVIITLGIFSALGSFDIGVNLEIDQTLIAALLTIIGYSINDTVVVFDRIRENFNEMKASALEDVFNISIDQTISRTIITSFTTFLSALILFIFGGDVIKGFFFAILIGVVVGTYSSIFVASPIALDLLKRQKKEQKKQAA
ncbi:MAG: protein translocase subunit SecDF [Bacteroidetes bacterium]|nr:MAG: protein translocase subunit SecDF [Bacteroidota bacterium]